MRGILPFAFASTLVVACGASSSNEAPATADASNDVLEVGVGVDAPPAFDVATDGAGLIDLEPRDTIAFLDVTAMPSATSLDRRYALMIVPAAKP
jgi:hypothetical protein